MTEEKGGKRDAPASAAPAAKRAKIQNEFVPLTFSVCASKGLKHYQQDMPVAISDLTAETPLTDTRYSYFAVYDGHAGEFCSKYLQEHLHGAVGTSLAKLLEKVDTSLEPTDKTEQKRRQLIIKKAFVDSFRKTDKTICETCKREKHPDGSCAIVMMVRGNVCWIANVGDSKAVMCRVKEEDGKMVRKPMPLSKDHTPLLLKERQRIEKTGAVVDDGRVNGRLGVSRSFGDLCVKKAGVIAQPDIVKFSITEKEKWSLLACDGLWSVFNVPECVAWVSQEIDKQWEIENDNKKIDTGLASKKRTITPVQAVCDRVCENLIIEATIARKCKDNCTAVLILFRDGL